MECIKSGSVVISFINQFNKDIEYYRLYSTNINEKIIEINNKKNAYSYNGLE